jgi:hypothetical protein
MFICPSCYQENEFLIFIIIINIKLSEREFCFISKSEKNKKELKWYLLVC